MEVEKKMRRFPGFDNEKSQNYIFDENIINNLKKKFVIFLKIVYHLLSKV